jgi:anti-sigma B factor antagonist
MNLEHHTQDGVDIVRLPERLMMADAADARGSLKNIISNGSGKLILDLTNTAFMDSSGLAVLVSSLQAARKKDGDVYLVGMGTTVRALFELTRLHTVFQIFDDEAGALRALT